MERNILRNRGGREKDQHHQNSALSGMTHFGYKRVKEKEKAFWVRRHFNIVADKYDLMNTLLSFGIHHIWKRVAVRCLNLKRGDLVLDLCGGTGDLSVMSSKRIGSTGKVILYDINRAMIKKGIARIAYTSARPNIFHIQGDAEQLSFPDDIFDAVIVGFGIRNLTHPEAGFREMHRVLKPGGKMVCLEFSQPTMPLFKYLYDFYSFHIMPFLGNLIVGSCSAYCYLTESIRMFPLPEELTESLRLAGFRNVKYRRLTNGIAVVHHAIKAKSPPSN